MFCVSTGARHWNQRSESSPMLSECAREDSGTEYLKSRQLQIIQGP